MTTQQLEVVKSDSVELGTLNASDARSLVKEASSMATVLADVIKTKGLSQRIGNNDYVKCEGWTTLAAMCGVTPREVSNVQLEDGSFEAVVELVRMKDQVIIGRASALCGMDERTWASRPKYARRSMAATRATGKACRLSFSWIMALSGYNVTPAEEIPQDDNRSFVREGPASAPVATPSPTPAPEAWEQTQGGSHTITEKQVKRIYAIGKKDPQWSVDQMKELISYYPKDSSIKYKAFSDIQMGDPYETICNLVENFDPIPVLEQVKNQLGGE